MSVLSPPVTASFRHAAQRTLLRPSRHQLPTPHTTSLRTKPFSTSRCLRDTPNEKKERHAVAEETTQARLKLPDSESQIPTANPAPAPSSTTSAASTAESTSTTSSRRFGPLSTIVETYDRNQAARPYWTQFWTSLIIYLCGDLSAQLLFGGDDEEGNPKAYDPLRTMRHLTVGAVSSIPSFKWFMFLHHNFNIAGSKFLSVLTKVVVQQACFTPIFNTYFFGMQSLLSGASLDETVARIKHALPSSLVNSLKLWPIVTFVNFWYLKPQYRSIFAGAVAVGWQSYLSWLNVKAAREVQAEEAKEKEALKMGYDGLKREKVEMAKESSSKEKLSY